MDWTIEPKLKQLNSKIESTHKVLTEDIKKEKDFILSVVTKIKADVTKDVFQSVSVINNSKLEIEQLGTKFKQDIQQLLDSQDQQNNQRDLQIYSSLKSLNNKVDRIQFDVIDNHDNISITYVNPDGKTEYAAVKKVVPDENTITMNSDNKLMLKQKFDANTFNVKDNLVTSTGLKLTSGNYITSDEISNSISTLSSQTKSLSYKLESAIKKLNTVNGYVASNNFRKATPTQEQLTEFAIKCLSNSEFEMKVDLIPSGTKIKNTFDNHIWILNRVTVEGLTTMKWEDFGTDSICIASNDGVHGLVTGSQERYRGYVDLKGVISINGLEEDLTQILKSIENINSDLTQISTEISAKLYSLEERIKKLES